MADLEIYRDTALRIYDQFEMDKGPELKDDEETFLSDLQKALARHIAYVMEHESEHLKWVLYRIDINEQKVLEMLAGKPLHEAIDGIADLIIERQLEKAVTRRQYSTGKGEMSFDI